MNRKKQFPKVSIIVLTFNALNFIKQCLASVKKYSQDYELIVVDNGSEADTVEWLKKQSGIRTIFNFENRGFAAGNNEGIKAANGEYILLLNSDVIVTKDWLIRLMKSAKEDNRAGLVGPYSNYVYARGDQRIAVSYPSLKEMHAFARVFNRKPIYTYHISGFCAMAKRKVIDRIGLLDERFKVGNYEDVDYCIRVLKAGFKLKIANCFIHHFGSRSFIDNINKFDARQAFSENFKILIKKWTYAVVKKVMPGL